MQVHDAIGMGGDPLGNFGTPVRQPQIVLMEHANPIGARDLDAEIGFFHPGRQIGPPVASNPQFVRKAIDDIEAIVGIAGIDNDDFNCVISLVRDRLEGSRQPPSPIMRGHDC
jgi:hypothetical protein